MSKKDEQIKALRDVADSNAGYIRAAFLAVIEEIRNNLFDGDGVEEAIYQNNPELALDATQINEIDNLIYGNGMDNGTDTFMNILRDLFVTGAGVAISNLTPTQQKAITFDPLNQRAVNNIHQSNATLATQLTNASAEGVRQVIERAMAENANIAQMVKEIRQLIGLTADQAQAVLNFRRQLEARQNLGFTPVDERRLDAVAQAMVRRHMKEGSLSGTQIDDMVERYFQSMLDKRAWDIARTESLNAVNNGQQELWEQGLDQGIFDDNKTRKFWVTTKDDRLRATHAVIPGMNPQGVKIRSLFVTPFGLVSGPGDANSGLINCRCCVVLEDVQ